MKNQKIVTIENGIITDIKDGHFECSYPARHQEHAIHDLLTRSGTDWDELIQRLEKVIIGLLKRNPQDREFIKEAIHPMSLRGLEEYWANTSIKRLTEKEKEKLIQKIRDDKF